MSACGRRRVRVRALILSSGVVLAALAALTATAPGGEAGALEVSCDAAVRLGLVFSCTVSRAVAPEEAARGPWVLQVSLTQAGQQLAAGEYPIARLSQLREPCRINLVPTAAASAEEAELSVILTNPQRSALQRWQRRLPTPLGLERALAADRDRLLAGSAAAAGSGAELPLLWVEQAGEAVASGWTLHCCAELARTHERLVAWFAGRRAPLFPVGTNELALRDPVDGSIQPYRLHLPPVLRSPVPLAVLCVGAAGALNKGAWPLPPAAWLAAARTAGVAVLEPYAAGDASWSGVAVARTRLALAASRQLCPGLAAGGVLLVGVGAGARGALALVEADPEACAALALVDPALALPGAGASDPAAPAGWEAWLALAAPGGRPAHLAGVPTALCGAGDGESQRWLERFERCGGALLRRFPAPGEASFWTSLAARNGAAAPREYVVTAPGRYGPVEVEAMGEWGVAGALRFEARQPLRVSTVGIRALRPSGDGGAEVDGRAWRASPPNALPAKVLGQAQGPLVAYGARPFAVVVGTLEHAAAAADNRQLAADFLSAWAAYAQGRPPVYEDRALGEQEPAGVNLVLIGNTRSNAVLARLAARSPGFPLRWDARSVITPGGTFLRSQRRAVALAWPHPALDGRLLVVLDGALVQAHPDGPGLPPCAGLPDLVVGGESPAAPAAYERLFSADWR